MPIFTFFLHETPDSVPSFEIAYFDEVQPALAHGAKLLKERPRYGFVEVAHGDRSVGRVSRDRAGASPPPREAGGAPQDARGGVKA